MSGKERQEAARRSLAAYQRALRFAERSASALGDAATVALEAGDLAAAKSYARDLVAAPPPTDQWNHGNALHHGHLVLGRLALHAGDVEAAKRHLLDAGRTPGSPQLDTFGPNMTFVKELLAKKQTDIVLQYFKLCARFWQMGQQQLTGWAAVVKKGGIPDFGANLN